MPHHNGLTNLNELKRKPNSNSLDKNVELLEIFSMNGFNNQILTKDDNRLLNLNTNKPLRVLICTESFHPYTSGIARRFKEIIVRLCKRGYFIHILTGCKGCETFTNDNEIKDKISYSSLFAIEFKDKIDCALPFLIPQYGMLKAIRDFKPDVVHCVETTVASTFCGVLACSFNIPIVWSSHTNLDYYIPLYIHPIIAPISLLVYQKLRRTFLNLADHNLTVSSDFVKLLNENGVKQKINVWKTGVDSESFNPSFRSHQMRLRMFNGNYSPDKILLVSVGRLSPEKNFEFLLKLLEKFPNAFLCIVGGGPYKDSLEPLFPPNQTHFMGFLQGEELASAYASADYFVYASVSETFGQVYLEAMSSGIPIVAAEGNQMKEFFINGIHGYTWKPDDIESACRALENAIKDRNILSQNCRSNALNHSWNSAANQIAEVYKSAESLDKEKSSGLARLKHFLRGVYYFFLWVYLILLVLVFMVPFMKVAKPSSCQEKSSKRRRKRQRRKFCFSSSSSRDLSREDILRNREAILVYNNELSNKIRLNHADRLANNFNDLSTNSGSNSELEQVGFEDYLLVERKSKRSKRYSKKKSRKVKSCGKMAFLNSIVKMINFKITKFTRNQLSSLSLISVLSVTAIYAIYLNLSSLLF